MFPLQEEMRFFRFYRLETSIMLGIIVNREKKQEFQANTLHGE